MNVLENGSGEKWYPAEGSVILLDRDLEVLRRVKRDGLKWVAAQDQKLFAEGFDTWMNRHSVEARRQLAGQFRVMPLPIAKDTINKLLLIFKSWKAAEKGEDGGKMGLSSDNCGGDGERDTTLSPVGDGGRGPGDGDLGPAGPLPE